MENMLKDIISVLGKKINLLRAILFYLLLLTCAVQAKESQQPIFTAIIFDCDGVLVDTEHLKFIAWKQALAKHHINFQLAEYISLVGYDTDYILNSISTLKKTKLPIKVIAEHKQIYYAMQARDIQPIKAAIDLAKTLAANKNQLKIKLALASSAPTAEIMRNLTAIGLEKSFDYIISGTDDLHDIVDPNGKNKPKPYIYQKAAIDLHVQAKDCLVFEDTAAGVMSAYTAGMTVFAVPNKFTKQQDFSKASKVLTSLAEFDITGTLHPTTNVVKKQR